MEIPPLALWTTILGLVVGLLAGIAWWVRKWSSRTDSVGQDASELLTNFQQLHARGGLSADEYRTIKAKLAPEVLVEASISTTNSGEQRSERTSDSAEELPAEKLESMLNAEVFEEERDSEG